MSPTAVFRFIVAAALCGLFGASAYAADDDDPTLGASLPPLLDYARQHSPLLAAGRYRAEAAASRTLASGRLPDPVLRSEWMDITRQGRRAPTLNPSQVGATRYLLMQRLPPFGALDLERDAAAAIADVADANAATDFTGLARRIKEAYALHHYASERKRLAEQMRRWLNAEEQSALARYAAGDGSQQEVVAVQLEKSRLAEELLMLESDYHHMHVRLNALLGRDANAPLTDPVGFRPLPDDALLAEQALVQRLMAHNPELRAAAAERSAAERGSERANLNRFPDLTLGIAPNQVGRRLQSWDLMLELELPLHSERRQAERAAAAAEAAAANARQSDAELRLRADLSESIEGYRLAQQGAELIGRRLLPQLELARNSARAALAAGNAPLSPLLEAERQLLGGRQQLLERQLTLQLRLADIEQMVGEEL